MGVELFAQEIKFSLTDGFLYSLNKNRMNQKNSSTSRDRKVFDLDLPINDTYTTRNRAEFLFLFNSYYVIAVM